VLCIQFIHLWLNILMNINVIINMTYHTCYEMNLFSVCNVSVKLLFWRFYKIIPHIIAYLKLRIGCIDKPLVKELIAPFFFFILSSSLLFMKNNLLQRTS